MKLQVFTVCLAALCLCGTAFAGTDDLYRPDGILVQKLVVTHDKTDLYKAIGDKGEHVDPMTIFWQMNVDGADDGIKEEGGKKYYRVGDADGNELGWISADKDPKGNDFATPWTTRYILEPNPVSGSSPCVIYKDSNCTEHLAEFEDIPAGTKAYAYVLYDKQMDTTPDSPKRVFVYTAPVKGTSEKAAGSGRKANPEAPITQEDLQEELEIDIVFVIDTTASMTPLIDMTKEVARLVSEEMTKQGVNAEDRNTFQNRVHFGLVEYRDLKGIGSSSPEAFDARVACPLNKTFADFQTALNGLRASQAGSDDVAEEVFWGIKTAIDSAQWHPMSSRHIIVLGDAPNKPAPENDDQANNSDYTTSCPLKSVEDVLNYASRGTGAETRQLLTNNTFHAVLLGYDGEAKEQFENLSINNTKAPGYMGNVSDSSQVEVTAKELARQITLGITTLTQVSRGQRAASTSTQGVRPPSSAVSDLAISNSILKLFGSAATGEQKRLDGFSRIVDDNGNSTSTLEIMVLREELEAFVDCMDQAKKRMIRALNGRGGSPRAALIAFLEDYIDGGSGEVDAVANSGKTVAEIVKLAFPVKSNCLNLRMSEISKYGRDQFDDWLKDLEASIDRGEKINNGENWYTSERANGGTTEYQFIKDSEMP